MTKMRAAVIRRPFCLCTSIRVSGGLWTNVHTSPLDSRWVSEQWSAESDECLWGLRSGASHAACAIQFGETFNEVSFPCIFLSSVEILPPHTLIEKHILSNN